MKIEIRANDTALISGYVNVVERESRTMRDISGPFVETVKAGVFKKSLERHPVELRFDHRLPLGSTKDGALELREDNIGLYAKAVVSDPKVVQKAREDKLSGWSFGFRSLKDSWVPQENGIRKRNLEDIDLVEVSILDVTPAYPATSIETRDGKEDLLEFRNVQEEIELDIEKRAENQEKTEPQSEKVDMNQLKREFEFVNLGGKR